MNDRFLRACRREPVDCTPVWFMRQAGRYMPEYRAIRERYGFLQMVKTPEVATEITLQPIHAFEVDAAIVFADILPPLEGMGLQLTYEKGEGPIIHNPVRDLAAAQTLRESDPRESVDYSIEAVRLCKRALEGKLPLIGFSGAPFTLAAYAIEGGGSKDFRHVKRFMHTEPEAWQVLMEKLSRLVADYLIAQIEAGADAVQLFDSWAGQLSPADYTEFVLPYVRGVVARVREATAETIDDGRWTIEDGGRKTEDGAGAHEIVHRPSSIVRPSSVLRPPSVPLIYFGTDMTGMGGLLRQTGAEVIGVDWRSHLDEAWANLGESEVAVQGNLDPATLFAPWPLLQRRAQAVLDRAQRRNGHIFNLGHGIMTETPVDQVKRLAEFVHDYSRR